jgi:hypothetical protein
VQPIALKQLYAAFSLLLFKAVTSALHKTLTYVTFADPDGMLILQ